MKQIQEEKSLMYLPLTIPETLPYGVGVITTDTPSGFVYDLL